MREAKCSHVVSLNLFNTIRFEGQSKTGEIGVVVDPEVIIRLGEILKVLGSDRTGHAVWHLNSPNAPFPCDLCKIKPA